MIGIAIATFERAASARASLRSARCRGRQLRVRPHPPALRASCCDVGVIGLAAGFIPHVFFADETAPPSDGRREVRSSSRSACMTGAWGVLGFLCIWIGGTFWLATGPRLVACSCSARPTGHIRETRAPFGTIRPDNFLTIFSDGFIADLAAGAALALLARRRIQRAVSRGSEWLPREPRSPIYSDSGGWQQAHASPTGSGPEGSSPNEHYAGCRQPPICLKAL